MKAIILAGGMGSRAKPFSDYSPKALIPINGRPIIDHIIRYMAKFPVISEILIVCEFDSHGRQIINYLEGKENIINKKITFIEDKKRGTGGSLLECKEKIKDDPYFLVWFSDNLCALELDKILLDFENLLAKREAIGMIIIRKKRYEETGRVVLGIEYEKGINLINEFIEKPVVELEFPEAAGIYIFNKKFMDILQQKFSADNIMNFDLSADILSRIYQYTNSKLYCYSIDHSGTNWIDVESPIFVTRNKKSIDQIILQMIGLNKS